MKKIFSILITPFILGISHHSLACGLNEKVEIKALYKDGSMLDLNDKLGLDDSCSGKSLHYVELEVIGEGTINLLLDGNIDNQGVSFKVAPHTAPATTRLFRFTSGPSFGKDFGKVALRIATTPEGVYIKSAKAVTYKKDQL